MNNLLKTLALPSLLFASQLVSASVVLLEDNRATLEKPISPAGALITYKPATPFSTWQSNVLIADPWAPYTVQMQNSQITGSIMKGWGTGFSTEPTMAELPRDFSAYNSVFDVKFSVQQTQIMTLSFALSASPFGYPPDVYASSSLSLQGPAGFDNFSAVVSTSLYPFGEEDNDYYVWGESLAKNNLVFTLTPGEYRLSSFTNIDSWTTSGGSWSLDAQFVNDVPLPASGWMLLSSLGSLAALRHTRRNRGKNHTA